MSNIIRFPAPEHTKNSNIPQEPVRIARRSDDMPVRSGDKVRFKFPRPLHGIVDQLGGVLNGRQSYSVLREDGVRCLAYAENIEAIG